MAQRFDEIERSYSPYEGDYGRYGFGPEHLFVDYTRRKPKEEEAPPPTTPESKPDPESLISTQYDGDGMESERPDDDFFTRDSEYASWREFFGGEREADSKRDFSYGDVEFGAPLSIKPGGGGGQGGQGWDKLLGFIPGYESLEAMRGGDTGKAVWEGVKDIAGYAFPPLGIGMSIASHLMGAGRARSGQPAPGTIAPMAMPAPSGAREAPMAKDFSYGDVEFGAPLSASSPPAESMYEGRDDSFEAENDFSYGDVEFGAL